MLMTRCAYFIPLLLIPTCLFSAPIYHYSVTVPAVQNVCPSCATPVDFSPWSFGFDLEGALPNPVSGPFSLGAIDFHLLPSFSIVSAPVPDAQLVATFMVNGTTINELSFNAAFLSPTIGRIQFVPLGHHTSVVTAPGSYALSGGFITGGPIERQFHGGTVVITAIPEPANWALIGGGLMALGYLSRRLTRPV